MYSNSENADRLEYEPHAATGSRLFRTLRKRWRATLPQPRRFGMSCAHAHLGMRARETGGAVTPAMNLEGAKVAGSERLGDGVGLGVGVLGQLGAEAGESVVRRRR